MTALELNLEHTAFSRRGSYFAVSRLGPEGFVLRTVHGDARVRELIRLVVGDEAQPAAEATAGRLRLRSHDAELEIALDDRGRAALRLGRGRAALDFRVASAYDVVLQEGPDTWRYIASGANRNFRLLVSGGSAELEAGWDGLKDAAARLIVRADREPVDIAIEEFGISAPPLTAVDIDAMARASEDDFADWHDRHGTAHEDPDLRGASRLASYVTWAALVRADGALRRESMLMSKNNMAHVWAWDHCFNAIALGRDREAAADQLLTLFDHQDAEGGLPDHIDDAGVQPNFAKPPIHGWAVTYLLDRGQLSLETLAALHQPLIRWTEWWFRQRVYGHDGVPSYNHGNDSGWDNSTVFATGVPVQSPDLLAFLALQMSAVARIADALGEPGGERWRRRAADTVALLIEHFWRGGRFVARETATGGEIASDSLLTLMPLTLGAELPPEVFAACVDRLVTGGYLTEHGLATEPVSSPFYLADGYWRGPVWAPTTMLLVDGLRRGGREDLAADVASRFLRTCARAGMAENFDAMSGEGLRDRSMTWTASVYLTLLGEHAAGANALALGASESHA